MNNGVEFGHGAKRCFFSSHREMVPSCYLILVLNFKGSGLF